MTTLRNLGSLTHASTSSAKGRGLPSSRSTWMIALSLQESSCWKMPRQQQVQVEGPREGSMAAWHGGCEESRLGHNHAMSSCQDRGSTSQWKIVIPAVHLCWERWHPLSMKMDIFPTGTRWGTLGYLAHTTRPDITFAVMFKKHQQVLLSLKMDLAQGECSQ